MDLKLKVISGLGEPIHRVRGLYIRVRSAALFVSPLVCTADQLLPSGTLILNLFKRER